MAKRSDFIPGTIFKIQNSERYFLLKRIDENDYIYGQWYNDKHLINARSSSWRVATIGRMLNDKIIIYKCPNKLISELLKVIQ